MITVLYKPSFVRQYKKLEPALKKEVKAKIEQFKDRDNHNQLEVHKLKGKLSGRYSFSVNYKYRIVFTYESQDTAVLLGIGDHDVYR